MASPKKTATPSKKSSSPSKQGASKSKKSGAKNKKVARGSSSTTKKTIKVQQGAGQRASRQPFENKQDTPHLLVSDSVGIQNNEQYFFASTADQKTPKELAVPEILSPAGDMTAALAAYAAGADAVYLGLKHFSARMQAENFSTGELARLADFAHSHNKKIYVAMNTLLKPNDPAHALRLIRRLALDVQPDALIVQDLGIIPLANEAGFAGEIHLSTLANVTHQKSLETAVAVGASRVIVPRELSYDEVRLVNAACPPELTLEMFVHGALCYCVSGRCWWSSYMGGKSGLRGRCVQPCRRVYKQKGREGRFFSCMDLSLDSLVKHLLPLENLRSWKIEGRRKSPHYVYHATSAYKLLRDESNNPEARLEAERILELALGRPFTRNLFTSRKGSSILEEGAITGTTTPPSPTKSKDGQTSSGLLCGKITQNAEGRYVMTPRLPLLAHDYLRVGYEDEQWHCTISVNSYTPDAKPFMLPIPRGKHPKPGTPVFLIDRKEPELMNLLKQWQKNLEKHNPARKSLEEDVMDLHPRVYGKYGVPAGSTAKPKEAHKRLDVLLRANIPQGRDAKEGLRPGTMQGLWLSQKAMHDISKTLYSRIMWWLPPVIWPSEDANWARLVTNAVRSGARYFVCNSPWQIAYFTQRNNVHLTAGPLCNTANAPAIALLQELGFDAAIISPELAKDEILSLPGQSALPLGIVVGGYFPMGISRHTGEPLKSSEGFQSPKGEEFWMRQYGQNTWIYPAWPLDITQHIPQLTKAGYSTFITMQEFPPKSIDQPKRTSEFNWNAGIL